MTESDFARAVVQELWIPLTLPGLNEILGASNTNRHVYNGLKQKWGQVVGLYARCQKFAPLAGPAHFEIELVEPNRRRDPDNIVGGAQKILFDALQKAGLMKNDGWGHVLSISTTWRVGAPVGVRLTVREDRRAA